jgi:Tol biopolymer transport system component
VYLVPVECELPSCPPVQVVPPTSLNTSPAWLDPSLLVFVSNRGGSRDLFAVRVEGRGKVNEPVRLSAGQDLHSVSAAADGRTLAYSIFRQSSNIWSLDVSGAAPRKLSDATRVTAGRQTVEGLDLSADGTWLAYDANRSGQQDIYVIPAAGAEGEPERVIATPDDDFHPNWSPDGASIAFYTFRDGVRRAATAPARGGPIRLVHPDGPAREEHSPVWMRDGQGLVYYRDYPSGASHLFMVRRATDSSWSAERQLTRLGGWALTFSADGQRATYIGPTPGLVRLIGPELDEASNRLVYDGSSAGANGIRILAGIIARDGSAYIAKGEDRISPGFWRVPLDGGAPRLLMRLDDPSRTAPRPEFATDGRRLFFVLAEREADVWVVRLEER